MRCVIEKNDKKSLTGVKVLREKAYFIRESVVRHSAEKKVAASDQNFLDSLHKELYFLRDLKASEE